jgi:chromosome partitioning protein
MVVIPLQPSPMDVWATKPTLQFAWKEKVPALLIMNRLNSRTNLAARMIEEAHLLGAEVADTTIGSRVAFAASLAEGKGVAETAPSSAAGQEIEALSKEIMRRVKAHNRKPTSARAA